MEISAKRIHDVIDTEIELLEDESKLVLGGFTEGALMSMKVGLERE